MSKLSKKTILIIGGIGALLILIIVAILFARNLLKGDEGSKSSSNLTTEHQACYDQCEEWGSDVSVCKENCDASFSEDSVWNDDDTDVVDDNDSTFDSWEEMPLAVPEFMYGDFVTGEEGMGSWIVDYENVTDSDAMENYVSDLEDYGWSVSYMSVSNMLTGSKDGYTISASLDPDYGNLQIIVRESN